MPNPGKRGRRGNGQQHSNADRSDLTNSTGSRNHNQGRRSGGKARRMEFDQDEDDEDAGIPRDENGFIAKGFTISFDGGDDFGEEDDDDDAHYGEPEHAPRGGYGSQVLPVPTMLPEDHDGNPIDGHEYLYFVR